MPMNQTETQKTYNLFAQNIIKTAAKRIFSKNRTLVCLVKSDYFFKELLNLFNELNSCGITPEVFAGILRDCAFSKTDLERLKLTCEVYDFYLKTMEKNGFKVPAGNLSCASKSGLFSKNQHIKQRLDYLLGLFEKKSVLSFQACESENVGYLEFSDVQNEALYVVDSIKKLVEGGVCSYSQIGVFVDKTETRQKFLDLLQIENIPVISSIYNEDYENLKHKISVYHKISEICVALGLETFSSESFKKISLASKSEKEILLEQLDEVVKNLLYELFEDDYVLDKIVSKKENSKNLSLTESVFALWGEISQNENDKELLISEFSSLKTFYELYKNGDFAQAAGSVIKKFYKFFEQNELKEPVAGKIKSLNELQNLYSQVLFEKPDFESFFEILQWLPPDKSKENNAVTLASISNESEKEFAYVFVSGLTENNFPGKNPSYPYISAEANNLLVEKMKQKSSDFEYFLKTDEIHFSQRFYSLCSLMAKTLEKIVFTTHSYEAKKQVQPSLVFKVLSEADSLNFKKIKNETQKPKTEDSKTQHEKTSNQAQKVISEEDVLKLNASAISTFQKCPRKYYYKNLLNLKEPSTFSASYGNVVHSVLEVLHRKYLTSFNKQTALGLAEILFNSKEDDEKPLLVGFRQTDSDLIKETDELSLAEMKDNFFDAVSDLDMCGYFDEVPEFAVCEKSFSFKLDGIPNVIFDGRIDAIISYDGKMRVVDYKTGKNKDNSLAYAISENGVNFKTDKGKDPSNVGTYINRYDYQIPLYYFACKYSEDLAQYKDKIEELGLLYVRPKKKDNGCDEDFVAAEKIELFREKIIQNLKETVVDKIFNETEFKKASGWVCENCAFKFLCDGEDDGE